MRMINALIPNNNNTELHTVAKGIGAEVGFGYVAADEYGHEASKAQHGDKFIGLPMDMDNEGGKKNDRIGRWVYRQLRRYLLARLRYQQRRKRRVS